jgi:hypothetical protein
MTGHDLIATAALAVIAAAGLSILIFQALTGVPPMSSSAAEGADVVSLLNRDDLPGRR